MKKIKEKCGFLEGFLNWSHVFFTFFSYSALCMVNYMKMGSPKTEKNWKIITQKAKIIEGTVFRLISSKMLPTCSWRRNI